MYKLIDGCDQIIVVLRVVRLIYSYMRSVSGVDPSPTHSGGRCVQIKFRIVNRSHALRGGGVAPPKVHGLACSQHVINLSIKRKGRACDPLPPTPSPHHRKSFHLTCFLFEIFLSWIFLFGKFPPCKISFGKLLFGKLLFWKIPCLENSLFG